MSGTPELPKPPAARAGFGSRLRGVFLGSFGITIGLVALFGMPERCRVLGVLAAVLFLPVGAWILFVSLRGRRSDLAGLSGTETAGTAATGGAAVVVNEVLDRLA